jgi:hypothetical protein
MVSNAFGEMMSSDARLTVVPNATNQTTIVESSTDLLHWEPIYFYAPPQPNFFDFSITNSSQQFFRTRSGP